MGKAKANEGGLLHEIVKVVRRGSLVHPDKLGRLCCFSVIIVFLSLTVYGSVEAAGIC